MSDLARQFDRLPPHSIEAEMCVIGSMLLAGNERAVLAAIRAEVDEADFFQADHAILFGVIIDLMKRDKSVDAMVIREELSRRQMLEEVGGLEYLAAILSSVPHYANGPQYAETVRSKAVLRRLIAVASDALRNAYAPQNDLTPSDLCRRFADAAAALSTSGLSDPVTTLGEAAQLVLDRRHSPKVRRIATGINTLDEVIGGLAKSKFTIVGADPRVGKSQLIKQIGLNVATRGIPFGLVTVEEDDQKVAENMIANTSRIPNHKISYGKLTDLEWDEVERGAFKLANLPYFIDDAQHKIGDVVSAIERLATKYKCEVIAVDHIHLITGNGENREREISEITKAMKAAFKRCNVAGIGAAQLNRGQEARQKPILKSLKGTSSLEQDGDLILLLFREDAVRYQEPGYILTRILEVDVAKNKDGRCGAVPLDYSGDYQGVTDPEIKDPF